MNFLKNVMQQFDNKALGLLGAVLGENESKVRDGVEAAVPQVLIAMASVSAVDEGRAILWRELRDTDASVASNFSEHLYYNNSKSLIASGDDQLTGILGVEANQLINAVGREADIGTTSARRLVGAVTPMVFASVANHQQTRGLDEKALGEVMARQKNHLSSWGQHKKSNLANPLNPGQERKPLFDSLDGKSRDGKSLDGDSKKGSTPEKPSSGMGGAAVVAAAAGSTALGMSHFKGGEKKDGGKSEPNSDSETSKKDMSKGSGFDERTGERRQREPFAANPAIAGVISGGQTGGSKNVGANTKADAGAANVSGTANASDASGASTASGKPDASGKPSASNKPSASGKPDTSSAAGNVLKAGVTVAAIAAGAGAAGVAAVSSLASTDGNSTDGNSATGKSTDGKGEDLNTYGSDKSVAGFAATADDQGTVDANGKRLWVPESAKVQGEGKNLDRQTAGAGAGAEASASKSKRRSSWLWLPLLFLLGGLGYFAVTAARNGMNAKGANGEGVALVADDGGVSDEETGEGLEAGDTDGSPASTDGDDAGKTNAGADSAGSAAAGEEEGDAAGSENGASATDSSDSGIVIEPADGSGEQSSGLSRVEGEGNTSENLNPTAAGSGTTSNEASDAGEKEQQSSKAENAEAKLESPQDAAGGDSETPSAIENTQDPTGAVPTEAVPTEAVPATLSDLDADEQMEALISEIESTLAEVKDGASAKAANASLSQTTKELESLLARRDQWEDEIEILVDFQLEEANKMLAQGKQKVFASSAAKKELNGVFDKLKTLMEVPQPSKPTN